MSDKQLAQKAYEFFINQSYDKALDCLNKIKSDKPEDFEVALNQTITNYKNGGYMDPKQLLDQLIQIKQKITDKIAQQDADVATNGTPSESTNGTTSTASIFVEADTFFTLYNQAVVYYQLKQYATALNILEHLFQSIEPVDEYLATHICFLLVQIYLICKQKDKVSLVLAYLEKSFPQYLKESDRKDEKDNATEKNASQIISDSHIPMLSPAELRSFVHLSKARLHLQNRAINLAKREIKLASLGPIANANANSKLQQNLISLLFKANLEYVRQNYTKAVKLLNTCSVNAQDNKYMAILYFNNLGCVHHKMKKHHTAAFYFGKALNHQNQLYIAAGNRGLDTFAHDRRNEILYNLGYQLLLTGKPDLAFNSFQECGKMFYKQAKYWLKVAECCIAAHMKRISESAANNSIPTWNLAKRSIDSQGNSTRFIAQNTKPLQGIKLREDLPVQPTDKSDTPVPGSQFTPGTLSMEYASKCVKNALFLVSQKQPPTPTSNSAANKQSPSVVDTEEEDLVLKQAILASGAYIALSISNPVLALWYARELLGLDKHSENYRLLANLYAAEALCLLNHPEEASLHLSPVALGLVEGQGSSLNISNTTPIPNVTMQAHPYSYLLRMEPTLNAMHVLFVNLAVVHILKEDLNEAQQLISRATTITSSLHASLIQIYLELRKGNVNTALQYIKKLSGE